MMKKGAWVVEPRSYLWPGRSTAILGGTSGMVLVALAAWIPKPIESASPGLPLQPFPPAVTVFEHVTVIPMDRERVLADQTVVIRGDRIVALDPAAQVKVPANATRIDGRGKFLIPGLSDMHVHFSPGRIHDSLALQRDLLFLLANGVTTIRVMKGWPGVLELRQRLARGTLLGPRLYAAGEHMDAPLTSTEAAQAVTDQQATGYDFIKIYSRLSIEAFDSAVVTAKRLGIPVVGHVPEAVRLERVFQAPFASIEHLRGYIPYLVATRGHRVFTVGADGQTQFHYDTVVANLSYVADSADSAIAAVAAATQRAGVWNCPTLVVFRKVESLLSGVNTSLLFTFQLKMVKALHEAEAGLLLGTDSFAGDTVGFGSGGIGEELKLLVTAGLTPYHALRAGSRNAAAFLGVLDSAGTIAVGKRADLVLLAGDPLVDVENVSRPIGVMRGGRWYTRKELEVRRTMP